MSGGNSANSSWTIVSPEETVAETVRPLEEQTNHHVQVCEPSNQPTEGADSTSSLSVDNHQDAEERKADPSDDSITERPPSLPSSVIDAPIPAGEVQSEVAPDNPNQDAFSDSLSHVTPSPDEPSGSPMSAETLGGAELTQQEERHDGTREEGLKQEGLESDLLSKHPDSSEQPGSDEEQAKDTESERKRLLASLERIGRIDEEEEGEEEEFQLPRKREDDNMFSLNRCILGAVILVALGTILFSGVFMDLDEESVYSTRELSDSEEPGRQEWLHPEALPPPVDAENSELLTKLAKGDQQISLLQAQLEAQKEQLKAAEGQAAEGEMTRMRWQEENNRLKSEVASLPVLEKENEMLRKELETLPTLQHELETLRSTVMPPSGQPADRKQNGKREKEGKEKHDLGENKERKKNEWKARKESGGTERKQADGEKRKQGKYDDVKEGEGKRKEEKDWKQESRGEEGKTWKERDVKKEQAEKMERKEWKKGKHEKQWRGEGEKEWRKDEGEMHKMKDKSKQKGKNGFEGHGKDKTWKSNNSENGKGGERKHAEDAKKHAGKTDDGKQWSHHGKGDKERRKNGDGQKRKEDSGELKGDKSNWHKHKIAGHHHEENVWAERKTSPPGHQQSAVDSTDYWTQQRKRLHRKPEQPQHCHSQEACAQAEGLHPVSHPHFESILHAYLAKAEQAGVDSSKRDQLRKLTSEFFQDGVFVHDRVNFRKFVKDVSDILEDMVEGDGEEDSDLEDEMEAFGREALEKFLVVGAGKQRKGEWRKENARASG